ncbi:DNA repair protein RecN [Bartonella sp. DGB1]|uniref:DNA repair protein RecN n=1 Tax=Bartonella sp. DGB1 TaxID=3239807 RepID=UPI003525E237
MELVNMLSHISVRDIVLIDKLEIDLTQGFSVFTGETGAGKSILLDALALALGGRGDAALVRAEMPYGSVSVVFDLDNNHPANDFLRANDFEVEDRLILRRIQYRDGKSKAYINDKITSIAFLKTLGKKLVELHGQHADRAFIDIDAHMDILDNFGNLFEQRNKVEETYQVWHQLNKKLDEHKEKILNSAREEEYLKASVAELAKLNVIQGEEEDLAQKRANLMKIEKIATDISDFEKFISGQHSPIAPLANFLRRFERKEPEEQKILEPLIISLDKIVTELNELDYNISALLNGLDFNENELEDTEQRLFALRAASRKYNVSVDMLPKLLSDYENSLLTLENDTILETKLVQQLDLAYKNYCCEAEQLSKLREDAAHKLMEAMQQELNNLKLGQATFIVKIFSDNNITKTTGFDKIEFWVQTNPNTVAGPMMKVASGGELARLLLALKVCIAENDSVATLVFDEIDTGVSGAVSAAIGQHLAKLSKKVQTLCVTHAAQVAAYATNHFLIQKSTLDESSSATNIYKISAEQRQEELARLLSGDKITSEARAAANSLLLETISSY